MALLRELLKRVFAGAKRVSARPHTGKVRNYDRSRLSSGKKWYRSGTVAVVGVVAVMSSAAGAWAYASSSGYVDGYGRGLGTGNGLVLTNFYSVGQNATFRQKWLGAYDSGVISSNTPAGVNTELWCIESGATVASSYAYSWSNDSNPSARYLMWLSKHSWDNPDARGAIQWLLYGDVYPSLGLNNNGTNFDYESRIWNHADFTAGARSYVGAFEALSTGQMHNTAVRIIADSHGGVPTKGDVDAIGVTDAWGNYIPGLNYTLTVTGAAVFDATGTTTVTGTTAASLINNAHAWTATGTDQVDFTISYANANVGATVYVGSGGGSQDMVAGAGFGPLDSTDPAVDVSMMFQPAGDTQVPAASVAPGDTLVDTFTPAASGGTTWPIDAGAYVPVTYDWALYDAGEVIPGAPVASAPAAWTLLETTQVIATGGPGVPITSTFTSTAQEGHAYVFVVSFSNANQPLATQGWFVADWSDSFGLVDETVYAPTTVTPSSTASSDVRGADTAVLDSVSFTGFPSDHGTFIGTAAFAADGATVQQRLYFFADGLDVTDANVASAELMCDLTVPATNGSHQVDDSCAIAHKDAWGQYVSGTYAWTSTFAGDARAGAFTTSVTVASEQVVFANVPLGVTTVAHKATPDVFRGVAVDVWDTATVTGFVPVGSTIKFALYRFDDAAAPVCDATTLLATLDPVAALAGAGSYESERFSLTPPSTAAVGFVETVYDADGAVLTRGACGAAAETLAVIRADAGDGGGGGGLARTGAEHLASILWATSGLLLVGVGFVGTSVYIRRRRIIA